MRLIDADALIDQAINGMFPKLYNQLCFCPKDINLAPTIDPVKHGRWIKGTSFGGVRCSECDYGSIIMLHYSSKYCPNCGARMDGEV